VRGDCQSPVSPPDITGSCRLSKRYGLTPPETKATKEALASNRLLGLPGCLTDDYMGLQITRSGRAGYTDRDTSPRPQAARITAVVQRPSWSCGRGV
jgi:hypothetical protein